MILQYSILPNYKAICSASLAYDKGGCAVLRALSVHVFAECAERRGGPEGGAGEEETRGGGDGAEVAH